MIRLQTINITLQGMTLYRKQKSSELISSGGVRGIGRPSRLNENELLAKIQMLGSQDISYDTLLCILLKDIVDDGFILKYMKDKYKGQMDSINRKWKILKVRESIIEDVGYLYNKNISENYRNIGIKQTKSFSKERNYSKYFEDIQTSSGLYWRKRQLQSQLSALSRKIACVAESTENLNARKQYEQKSKQLLFLRDYKRRRQQLKAQKSMIDELNINSTIVQQLSEKMEQKSKGLRQKKRQQITEIFQIISELKSKKDDQRWHSQSLFNQLQKVFYFYSKQVNRISQFQQLNTDAHMLKYNNFSHFIRDCELNDILTRQEILKMFNINSKFKKSIRIQQFYNLIKDLCAQYCHKLQIQFKSSLLCSFIHKLLEKWRGKYHKIGAVGGKRRQIEGHTGKYKQDIIELLKQKKQSDAKGGLTKSKIRSNMLDSRLKQPSFNRQSKSQNKNISNSYLSNYHRSIMQNKTERGQYQHLRNSSSKQKQYVVNSQLSNKNKLALPTIKGNHNSRHNNNYYHDNNNRYKTEPDQSSIKDKYLQSLIWQTNDDALFDEYMNLQKKR